jgi:hypothetical protein
VEPAQTALWERQPGETSRAYVAFRRYRDLGPLRTVRASTDTPDGRRMPGHVERWASRHAWVERAEAWDEELYRIEDSERLEAIRRMHATHQRAGRAAMPKGLRALEALPVERVPAGAAARLLDLGARLERDTLLVSVADLQGVTVVEEETFEDPWAVIARELDADLQAS